MKFNIFEANLEIFRSMLLVYTQKITPRVQYVFKWLFGEMLNISWQPTSDKEYFISYTGAKLNYSPAAFSDELFVESHSLLFENNIHGQLIEVFEKNEIKYFFKTSSGFYMDIFAASFYLLSRYEEYLPHEKDKHGRFEASQSLAYKNHFLNIPVIDNWCMQLKDAIREKYPQLIFTERTFRFIPTIDIDQAYSLKYKSFPRIVYSFLKSYKNIGDIRYKWNILLSRKKDPFDQYEKMQDLHHRYNLHPVFFFLLGKFNRYDINIDVRNTFFRSLIKSISDKADVGIHPSYASGFDAEKIQQEKKTMEEIIRKPVAKSRQHYLKMQIPDTYRSLQKAGIEEDYTMGYASQNGFRAGTCTSFYFFDLSENTETGLRIHPFCVMDATFKSYLKTTPDKALKEIEKLMGEVKKVNGTFISLWHNESMSGYKEWEGWENVYEEMFRMSK